MRLNIVMCAMKNRLLANLLDQRDGEIYGTVRREIERAFDDYARHWPSIKDIAKQGLRLKVDLSETDNLIEVTAELPGVAAKDIDVKLKDNILTIKGEKKQEKDEIKKDYHITERSYGSFSRSFTLPAEVDDGKAVATFAHGTLHISLPKSPQSKNGSKTIPVKAS